MSLKDELLLLIKSKYPVIYLESVDEQYCMTQIKKISKELNFNLYHWSVTDGLRKGKAKNCYYMTQDPNQMLKMIFHILTFEELNSKTPSIFLFKDFHKLLDDQVILRLTKDLINKTRNTQNNTILLSSEYKLPKDLEQDTAHIIGGYPDEAEIAETICNVISELKPALNFNDIEKIAKTLKRLTLQQVRNILNQCILNDNTLGLQDLNTIEIYKRKIFDQEGLLEFCAAEVKENVAGFSNMKRWLSERKESFHNNLPNLPPPKGILLMGVQGCGKSLAVKAIAMELNLPLYRLDLAKLYSKYIGETEENLRRSLATVDKLSPMCLWIDEIEKGLSSSQGDIDGGVSQRILGTFLTWMQERKNQIFLAATANNVYQLPPELLRKGRFDEIFFVDLPSLEVREELFNIHLIKRGLASDNFDCKLLARTADDFNGAEIEQAIISATYKASSDKTPISTEHILAQIQSTKPLAVLKSEDITALREWSKERTIEA